MDRNSIIHILRNPFGYSEEVIRKVRLAAADLLHVKPAVSNIDGHQVIEAALAKASKLNPLDAPFPMVGEEALAYLKGSASAYQHALEMIPASLYKQKPPMKVTDVDRAVKFVFESTNNGPDRGLIEHWFRKGCFIGANGFSAPQVSDEEIQDGLLLHRLTPPPGQKSQLAEAFTAGCQYVNRVLNPSEFIVR